MLKDYVKVLNYFVRLNEYTNMFYGKDLADIDYMDNRSVLELLFIESNYFSKFKEFKTLCVERLEKDNTSDISDLVKTYFPDIKLDRKVEEMSDDDLINVINMSYSNQIGDFLIIRYNEIRIFNNKLIKGKPYNVYDGLFQEMRSIVVNIRTFQIVSLPFYKFMNMNETEDYSEKNVLNRMKKANTIEYSNKLDGSFIQITKLDKPYSFYKYDDLLASSRNVIDTAIVLGARTWYEGEGNENYKKLVSDYPDYTIMFEWISMEDRHVVVYHKNEEGLYLIGMRHKETGEIKPYKEIIDIAKQYNIKSTEIYSGTYEDIRESLCKYKSSEKEGYVINIDGFLVKLKCEDYLNMVYLLRETSSANAVIRAISSNSLDDILSRVNDSQKENILYDAEIVYEYINGMDSVVNSIVSYLMTDVIPFKEVEKWIKTLPKLFRGCVNNKYFNLKKHNKEIEINYLTVASKKGIQGYITMKELKERLEIIKKFNLKNYII